MNSDGTGLIHSTTTGEPGSVDTRVPKSSRARMWGWGGREDTAERSRCDQKQAWRGQRFGGAQRKGSRLSLGGSWKLLGGQEAALTTTNVPRMCPPGKDGEDAH